MSTLLIISTNPGLLTDGAKLAGILAAQNNLPEHHHVLEPMEFCTVESIQVRAETLTPLLKEILEYRPVPHWGINE